MLHNRIRRGVHGLLVMPVAPQSLRRTPHEWVHPRHTDLRRCLGVCSGDEVVKVTDVTGENLIQRELALVKVAATERTRADVMRLATDIYRARFVDATPDSLILEVTGPSDKIDSLLTMIRPYGIKEVARTGLVAMVRGSGSSRLTVVQDAVA